MARNKYRLCPDWKYRTYFDWIWNVELSKTLIIVDYRLGFLPWWFGTRLKSICTSYPNMRT